MILKDEFPEGKPEPVKRGEITPLEFFTDLAVGEDGAVQCVVTCGPNGAPSIHNWCEPGDDVAAFLAQHSRRDKFDPAHPKDSTVYFSLAAFNPDNTRRTKPTGRDASNALALRAFWLDIDAGPTKLAKHGIDKVYETTADAIAAAKAFHEATGLRATHLVRSGCGVHIYYVSVEPIAVAEWLPRAKGLAALALKHGLKIDTPITSDAARIMRAPGSRHEENGKLVIAKRQKADLYTLEKWDALISFDPATTITPLPRIGTGTDSRVKGINGEVLNDRYNPYSYKQAAEKCRAMRKAAENNGRDTPYAVWILAARSAELSTEGLDYAHEISSGHTDYDVTETDKKLDSLTGGPANKDAWAAAYGTGGPCDSCEWNATCKTPAVQFGTLVNVSPPGEAAAVEPDSAPAHIAELNKRYAVVLCGGAPAVADFQSAITTTSGVQRGFGLMSMAAFRQTLNGRLAPPEKPGEKARPLADVYLSHDVRRQYEAMVYAPGEVLPHTVLNIWQGFAVKPSPGDVSLWLQVLEALIPNPAERVYFLHWVAWKIQNPGGVPDTILILKGAKGTGKNSVFDVLLASTCCWRFSAGMQCWPMTLS